MDALEAFLFYIGQHSLLVFLLQAAPIFTLCLVFSPTMLML